MRILACFSFAFAAGALLSILGLPTVAVYILLAVFALTFVVMLLLKGRKERVAAVLALGALFGLLRAEHYFHAYIAPAEAAACEDAVLTLELTAYPRETPYGASAEGYIEQNDARFRVQMYLPTYDETWKPGDRITGSGRIAPADGDVESGSWYYRSIGVPMRGALKGEVETVRVEKLALRYYPAYLASRLRTIVTQLFPEDVRGYMQALLTGDKSGLSYQQRSDLKISGIYHALAVSGMHVAMLMSALAVITAKRQRLYVLLGLPVLAFYCAMVGGMPSVLRASVMQIFLMLAPIFRREPDTPTSLGAALLVLCVQNPWCLVNTGMQLSFLATAGIVAFHPSILKALTAKKMKHFRRLRIAAANITAASVSAMILTVPVMAYSFGMISLVTILTNLLALQAITWCFFLGFVAAVLGFISLPAASVPAFCCTWLVRYVCWITGKLVRVPFAAVYLQTPYLGFWLIFAYVVIMLLISRKKAGKPAVLTGIGCMLIMLCICLILSWFDKRGKDFTFTVLDVGQGQCLLYRSGNETAAVDCGGSHADQTGDSLAEVLLSGGDNVLDYLILTHYDEDHTGGVEQLLYRIDVDTLLLPDTPDDSGTRAQIELLAREAGTEICYVHQDICTTFGEGTLTVYAPQAGTEGNAGSLSVLASFDDYDILATGDLASAQEKWLLQTHELPDLEILVAGHHGSASSTSDLLLQVTKPEIVVISVGENSYGHPTEEVLTRITERGAEIYRTDLNGTITIGR